LLLRRSMGIRFFSFIALCSCAESASDVESEGNANVNISGNVNGDVVSGINCKPSCNNQVTVPCPTAPPRVDACADGIAKGTCKWDGSSPFCEGACTGQSVQCESKSCSTGSKQLCCPPVQDIAYTCEVNIEMTCGCGNNQYKMDCKQYKSRSCNQIEKNTDLCNQVLEQFALSAGKSCTGSIGTSGTSTVYPRISIFLCLGFMFWSIFGDITVGGNVEGDVVEGINCKMQIRKDDASNATTSTDTTVFGCGNTYYQINCDMSKKDECSIASDVDAESTGSSASGEGGTGKGAAGLGLALDFSQQTTSADPGCNNALEVFKKEHSECGSVKSGDTSDAVGMLHGGQVLVYVGCLLGVLFIF